jgi:hypothetical protein
MLRLKWLGSLLRERRPGTHDTTSVSDVMIQNNLAAERRQHRFGRVLGNEGYDFMAFE